MDIFEAARRGDLARVRILVEQDEGAVCAHGAITRSTALMSAASHNRLEVVRYLLDHGADIHYHGEDGLSALHLASMFSDAAIVQLLLARSADTTRRGVDGMKALKRAATDRQGGVVRVLLVHGGSNVDTASYNGRTAAHLACRLGSSGVMRQPLDAGANPTLRTRAGHTALDLAAIRQHEDCMTLLQEWERAYMIRRARSMQDLAVTSAST